MILQKYVAAINSIAIVVLSALIAVPSGQLNWTSGAQIASIGISGVVLYMAPLLNVNWQGILKTGAAILGALVATAFPLFQTVVDGQPFKPIYIALIVLAIAHALGTQVGVDIRTDTAAIVIGTKDTTPVESTVNQDEPFTAPQPDYFSMLQQPVVPEPVNATVAPNTAIIAAVNPANQE